MISVIIPFFNAQATLEKCIKSLLLQTFDNFEVILVNDNSTDQSSDVISHTINNDHRFRIIDQVKNKKGPSAARNLGINHATRTYLYFLDSDDWIEPDTFEKMTSIAVEANACLVCASHFQDTQSEAKPKYDGTPDNDHSFSEQELTRYISHYLSQPYIYVMLVHCWGKLYQRSIIKQYQLTFNEALSQLEDVNFNFHYLCHTDKVVYKNEFLYHHSQTNNQESLSKLTGTEDKALSNFLTAYSAIDDYLKEKDQENLINAEKQVAHLFINTVIITLIRLSKKELRTPSIAIACKVMAIAKSDEVLSRLHHYQPQPSESKLIFWALKTRQPILVLISGLIRASVLVLSK